MDVTEKAVDNQQYFSEYNRAEKFAKETNETLRPSYIKKDLFSQAAYLKEYNTAYYESLYTIVNTGISEGYLVKLPKYTETQFKKASNAALSKLMNRAKLQTGRSIDLEQIYTNIVSGVEQGLSLPKINRQLDQVLGYRDSAGKWIADPSLRKGQTYKTTRTLRTETLRMRATADTDQWINQQEIVPSKLQLIETLDDRTRAQSAQMDGQIANKEGKFKFPEVGYKFAHNSGVAKFDINDRSTTITLDEEFPPESRIERDPVTGENKVVPYKDFRTFAKEKGMTHNKFGEELFPKKSVVKAPIIKKPTLSLSATSEEAQNWAIKNNLADNVSFKGLSDKIATSWTIATTEVLNKYPKLREKLNFIGTTQEGNKLGKLALKPKAEKLVRDSYPEGTKFEGVLKKSFDDEVKGILNRAVPSPTKQTYGVYHNMDSKFRIVSINKNVAKDTTTFIEHVLDGQKLHHWSKGNALTQTAFHEYGHALDDLLKVSDLPRVKELYITKMGSPRVNLSSYGGRNREEMVAEAFSEYMGSENPREVAKEIGEIINETYKNRFR